MIMHIKYIDQFIFMSYQYDLSTLGLLSNLTGGHVEYYNYTSDNYILNSIFEKTKTNIA